MTAIEFNTRILNEKQSLKNFALSLTRNNDDALDLVQDTYVKAITYREKFGRESLIIFSMIHQLILVC